MDGAMEEDRGEEGETVTCSDEGRGEQRRCKCQAGKERKGMPGRVTVAILSSACVDTVSCISLRNKLFLLAQTRASSSSRYTSLTL